jgi:hypothetical protein
MLTKNEQVNEKNQKVNEKGQENENLITLTARKLTLLKNNSVGAMALIFVNNKCA